MSKYYTNLDCWKTMQKEGYFEKHPRYKGLLAFGKETIPSIGRFMKVEPSYNVIILGCGYGREVLQLAPHVKHVYGIDVNSTIINKATTFTKKHSVENFTGYTVEEWERDIPEGIDLVYSMAVVQHLSRDIVLDYFKKLPKKLAPRGTMVIQFLEKFTDIYKDPDNRLYEPQVSWTKDEIGELATTCGLEVEIKTIEATEIAVWHWGCFRRGL